MAMQVGNETRLVPVETRQVPEPPAAPLRPPRAAPVAWPWGRFLLALAAVLLSLSLTMPYWSLTLHAPQYPGGLNATIYTQQLEGDISEIDGLNHYIGMMKLGAAARIERGLAPVALPVLALLALLAAFLRPRWAALLATPVVTFPFIFVADLFYWLYRAGHELDQRAALHTSVGPFTPHLLGVGRVGQFSTTARFELGLYVSLLAALVALVGIVLRFRRAAIEA